MAENEELESKVVSVDVEKLHFDLKNPRFASLSDEMDALHAFCSAKHARKTVLLAEDIAKRGLNPSELLIVIEGEGQRKGHFVVVEGNRRLCALRLLSIPQRAVDSPLSKAFQSRIRKAADLVSVEGLPKVACRLLRNRDTADYWIALKHTGENDGIGVVQWDGEETARFRGSAPSLHLLDYVKANAALSDAARSGLEKFSVTNLERLLGDPAVRDAIGVDIQRGILLITKKPDEFLRAATKIVEDIATKKVRVGSIKGKEDRGRYINSIGEFLPKGPSLAEPIELSEATKKPSGNKQVAEKTPSIKGSEKVKSNPSSLDRKALIPRKCGASIYVPRVNEVFLELRKLQVHDFPNAVSALLRVLLDTTTNEYVEKFSIAVPRNAAGQAELRPRLDAVLKNFAEKTKERELAASARNALLQQTGPIFAENLHLHLHGRYEHPQPINLLRGWDMIEGWFVGVWKILNVKAEDKAAA